MCIRDRGKREEQDLSSSLLLDLVKWAEPIGEAHLAQSFTLESAATPLVIVLFALAMDLLVRHSNTHTAERQLKAISLLQTQIELQDQDIRAPLHFAVTLCNHPDLVETASPIGSAHFTKSSKRELDKSCLLYTSYKYRRYKKYST